MFLEVEPVDLLLTLAALLIQRRSASQSFEIMVCFLNKMASATFARICSYLLQFVLPHPRMFEPLLSNTSEKRFHPEAPISRGELAAIMARMQGLKGDGGPALTM